MYWPPAIGFCIALANSANVMAQGMSPNLSSFISAAQGLASALDPPSQSSQSLQSSSTTSSSSITSTSSSSSTSTTPTITNSPTSNTASSPAAASSSAASSASNDSSGISPHTRDIILGVTIPVGLLILAAIILGLFLCCRRRRRTRRAPSPESKFAGNKDWEHGDNSHHGYSDPSLRTEHSNGFGNNVGHDSAPLMGAVHHSGPLMSENQRGPHMFGNSTAVGTSQHPMDPAFLANHNGKVASEPPAYQNINGNPNVQNPFTPVPPITRKPVPNRGSTGSNMSGVSGNHHDHRHSALESGAAVGAGALAGAALMHHLDKNRHSDGYQNRPESWHRPLGSHPHEPGTYATAGPTHNNHYGPRPNTPPFSPDDVGSMHRRSSRFSHASPEPIAAVPQHQTNGVNGAIIAPTAAQRRSLQSRNSSYSDGRDISRGPSRSPRRRSLTGGGEMWEADTVAPLPPTLPTQSRHNSGEFHHGQPMVASMHSTPSPALPTQSRHNSGEFRHGYPMAASMQSTPSPALPTQSRHNSGDFPLANPMAAAARPNRSRHNSQESRFSSSSRQPALPSNRHIGRSRKPHLFNNVEASNTDSSTSNDSWESAQAEFDPWEDRDTGRYPRFSGGSTGSSAPLMPPSAAWDETRERRWSGDIFNRDVSGHRFSAAEPRRNSGGMERRRLRFSEGAPEYYNEQGLVGRAL